MPGSCTQTELERWMADRTVSYRDETSHATDVSQWSTWSGAAMHIDYEGSSPTP